MPSANERASEWVPPELRDYHRSPDAPLTGIRLDDLEAQLRAVARQPKPPIVQRGVGELDARSVNTLLRFRWLMARRTVEAIDDMSRWEDDGGSPY